MIGGDGGGLGGGLGGGGLGGGCGGGLSGGGLGGGCGGGLGGRPGGLGGGPDGGGARFVSSPHTPLSHCACTKHRAPFANASTRRLARNQIVHANATRLPPPLTPRSTPRPRPARPHRRIYTSISGRDTQTFPRRARLIVPLARSSLFMSRRSPSPKLTTTETSIHTGLTAPSSPLPTPRPPRDDPHVASRATTHRLSRHCHRNARTSSRGVSPLHFQRNRPRRHSSPFMKITSRSFEKNAKGWIKVRVGRAFVARSSPSRHRLAHRRRFIRLASFSERALF